MFLSLGLISCAVAGICLLISIKQLRNKVTIINDKLKTLEEKNKPNF